MNVESAAVPCLLRRLAVHSRAAAARVGVAGAGTTTGPPRKAAEAKSICS